MKRDPSTLIPYGKQTMNSETETIVELAAQNCEEMDSSDVDPFASEIEDESELQERTLNVKVFIPIMSKEIIQVQLKEQFTIVNLLEALKEDYSGIFDSNGKFIGNIYWNEQKVEDYESVLDESVLGDEEEGLIIMIHNLIKAEESQISDSDEQNQLEDVVATLKPQKTSLMSKFKNLWNSKTPPPSAVDSTKSNVFGRPLDELNMNAESGLPEFVSDVLNYLREPSQIQEGLFRLSGTFTKIQSYQDRLSLSGESLKAMELGSGECHNVTSLFKQFLRNLPEPLMTFELYEGWRALGGWTEHAPIAAKIAKFLVKRLPEPNQRVLRELMAFLHLRLADSGVTRMNACNYGTVIGPNLLWHPQEDRNTRDSTTLGLSLQSSTLASQICTLFLQQYEEIFDHDVDVGVVAYAKCLYEYSLDTGSDADNVSNVNSADNVSVSNVDTADSKTSDSVDSVTADSVTSDTSDTNYSSPLTVAPLSENQIIFVTGFDDSFDGWWRGYTTPPPGPKNAEHFESRFPSNYVKVLLQCPDSEIINLKT